jgi:hypothetical protein
MSSEGYLQLKIRENNDEISFLKNELSNMKAILKENQKILNDKIYEFKEIENEIKEINPLEIKKIILEEVSEKIRKKSIRDNKRNNEEQREILKEWYGEIFKRIVDEKTRNEDILSGWFRDLAEFFLKIFEDNDIKINKNHLKAIRIITSSSEENEKLRKEIEKEKKKELTEEGYRRLSKALPKVNVYSLKKDLENKDKKRIEDIKRIIPGHIKI